MKRNWKRGLFIVPLIIVGIVAFTAVVMGLWNAILPDIIKVSPITFWQAFGILVLSKILFGGLRGGGGWRRGHYWRHRMQEKWASMTPEEREKYKAEWRNRWRECCGPEYQDYKTETESGTKV